MNLLLSLLKAPLWVIDLASWDKSFRHNPILGNPILNALGLYVLRVALACGLYRLRLRLFLLSPLGPKLDRKTFLENGFIIKRDFLPACATFTREPRLGRLMRYASSKNRPPFFHIESVWQHARKINTGGYGDGAFRVDDSALLAMGLGEARVFEVPANTLLIGNVFGFHKRGDARESATRRTVWMQARDNPFNPFLAPLPRLTGSLFELFWSRYWPWNMTEARSKAHSDSMSAASRRADRRAKYFQEISCVIG